MSRKILIATTQKTGLSEIHSGATTWGGLKNELGSSFGDLSNMRVVVRHTRNDLESDNAVLPEGEFTLIFSSRRIKAGYSEQDIVSILERLKEKFSDSIDTIIEEIEEGDFEAEIPKKGGSLPADIQEIFNEIG